MRFLVDAHLPLRLARRLTSLGHHATHTLDLPSGNRTADTELGALADEYAAIVLTKDADFVINRTLKGSPRRLLLIATGNIGNTDLIRLIETNLSLIEAAFVQPAFLEISQTSLVFHE